MKHKWYYDEAGKCTQCERCGYVYGEQHYQKCPMKLPSECPECGRINGVGEDCKKCGHTWRIK